MSLTLNAATLPLDTEFPGTPQGWLALIVQYLSIIGNENAIGLLKGSTTPAVEDRDKPWLKTTGAGNPIGIFTWNGSAWAQTPLTGLSGTTAQRPAVPQNGTQYFDTTINAALVFERSKWRTMTGSPGDIKHVSKPTLAEAITQNPGWVQYADGSGRVLGAAGEGPGLTARAFNDKVGVEDIAITTDQLPAHAHEFTAKAYGGAFQNGPQPAGVYPYVTGSGVTNTGSVGLGKTHSNMQPTIFVWCLIKE